MDALEKILESLATRQATGRWGIGTAAQYLKSIEPCFSGGLCPISTFKLDDADRWQKELAAAVNRLTYCDDVTADTDAIVKSISEGTGITSGAVLEYDCVLSSRRKDRDGDILESKGMEIDGNMPLLWQHIQLSPIGKHVKLLAQDESLIKCKFAIADTALGRDAAVLVKFGALRKSHGFKPLEIEPVEVVKLADGKTAVKGWHVKRGSVLEGSLVSIPANSDSIVTSVYEKNFGGVATAFSRDALKHPLVQRWAKSIFDARPVQSPGVTLTTKGIGGEGEKTCPKCPGKLDSTGSCPACGHVTGKSTEPTATKAGKVLSATNAAKLKQASGLIDEVLAAAGDMETDSTKGGKDAIASGNELGTKAACGCGTKAAAALDAKSVELEVKGMYSYDVPGSFQWITNQLYATAKAYLKSKSVDVGGGYVSLIATFADRAVICVWSYDSNDSKCYQAAWKLGTNDIPQWDGEPKEVTVAQSVIEKVSAAALATKSLSAGRDLIAPAEESLEQLARRLSAKCLTSDSDDAAKALSIVGGTADLLKVQSFDLSELLV